MTPAMIMFILEAIERGVPVVVSVISEVSAAIAASKDLDAQTAAALDLRLEHALLPERHFKRTLPAPGADTSKS